MENKPAKRETKAAKKKLLIALGIVLGVLLLLTGASYLIDFIGQEKGNTTVTEKEVNYKFYPADFEENIFENQDYLKLLDEGKIFFDFKEGNLTLGILREDAYKYGDDLKFMTDVIYAIIYGDNDLYNGYFTDNYYKTHSPKEEFTMQMLYNIKVERISSGKVEVKDGGDYTKSVFAVEYKIYHNNGTFRRDIGAGSKKQYITVTNQGGRWLIDAISTVN